MTLEVLSWWISSIDWSINSYCIPIRPWDWITITGCSFFEGEAKRSAEIRLWRIGEFSGGSLQKMIYIYKYLICKKNTFMINIRHHFLILPTLSMLSTLSNAACHPNERFARCLSLIHTNRYHFQGNDCLGLLQGTYLLEWFRGSSLNGVAQHDLYGLCRRF
jgi:hypothetical protein